MFRALYPIIVRRAVLNEPKPIPGLTLAFNEVMILFDQIIQILVLSQFCCLWQCLIHSEGVSCFRISSVFIHIDDTRRRSMSRTKGFTEEALYRSYIPFEREQKISGVSLRVHGSVQIRSLSLDGNISFIFLQHNSITCLPLVNYSYECFFLDCFPNCVF